VRSSPLDGGIGVGLETIVTLVVALVLGTAVGSFLNVVIHRVPRRESIVSPGSHCPSCGRAIRWFDNVPLFGWLWLRGRCRDCRAPIAVRYPLVELLTGLLAAGLALRLGFTIELLGAFWFAASLLALTFIDLDHRLLPDRITLPGIVAGLLLAACAPTNDRWVAIQSSVIGILVGGGVLWVVAQAYRLYSGQEGMGGGDIKLLAMIGAFLGWQGVLLTLLLASFAGSAVGIVLMIVRRADSKLAIPFGPFLALGALVALFWGGRIVGWYISSFGLSTS
jgi:leader peptidase (prepilin peptidase) / N-methyltransferase